MQLPVEVQRIESDPGFPSGTIRVDGEEVNEP